MAGVSRHMARSFVSTARAAGRFCGNKTASGGGEMSAAARGGFGFGGGAAAPRSAPSSSFSSSKSFFMESRRPGVFFGRLPGEVAMIQSLLPLHNATASARMVSQLRSSAGALLQEIDESRAIFEIKSQASVSGSNFTHPSVWSLPSRRTFGAQAVL